MLTSLFRIGLTAALFGLFFVPTSVHAQGRPHKVDDQANLFSKEAIADANLVIAKIKETHKKDLHIETRDKGPEKDKAAEWARQQADRLGVDGVYIMISKAPPLFEIYIGNQTDRKDFFTKANRDHVKGILSSKLGKQNDEALREIVNYTQTEMDRHAPQPVAKKNEPAPQGAPQKEKPAAAKNQASSMPGWVGWVCLIVGGLLVVWVVFALIRALTGGMGGGSPGYGGGYGGGGMGAGGGFLTGMLGGLFGAMAGMYIYNHFFGGHASMMSNGAVNWAGDNAAAADTGAAADPYKPDTDGTSEGGDWGGDAGGGDAGGGDAGGGGGDWGGGGGGDWGGGDAGGGDWGGGGGGDWGGGGGDFGGGGGGGDW